MEITGKITDFEQYNRAAFLLDNDFSQEQIRFIDASLDEAVENGFEIGISGIYNQKYA
jgi:hypothetical protein